MDFHRICGMALLGSPSVYRTPGPKLRRRCCKGIEGTVGRFSLPGCRSEAQIHVTHIQASKPSRWNQESARLANEVLT